VVADKRRVGGRGSLDRISERVNADATAL
jgi:hypothetical protein